MKIRKGDQVQIVAGKDRGKRGKVLRTLPQADKVIVEGFNLVKRHIRPRKGGEKGQRAEIPAPLMISNVMIVCPQCGKLTRIGCKLEKTQKIRICKKCNSQL